MARLKAPPWQAAARQSLGQLLARQVHAVLLHGAAGIGKLDLALDTAETLLCEQRAADAAFAEASAARAAAVEAAGACTI